MNYLPAREQQSDMGAQLRGRSSRPYASPTSVLLLLCSLAAAHGVEASADARSAAAPVAPAPWVDERVDAEPLTIAAGRDPKLKRCRYLHRRIEHFTRLRRAGGSGAQMERWRRSRQRFEEEYRRKRCYRFGRKLTELR